jgi:GMP synthase (glutamine-hydrolysing)
VFGPLGSSFAAAMGHQDVVVALPSDAVLLASTDLVRNQAFCIDGKPIYCTQFHPELDRKSLLERVWAYPSYVERIARVSLEEFALRCGRTPKSEALLPRFVQHVFG